MANIGFFGLALGGCFGVWNPIFKKFLKGEGTTLSYKVWNIYHILVYNCQLNCTNGGGIGEMA